MAGNPILRQADRGARASAIHRARQMMDAMRAAGDPAQMMERMAKVNPQLNSVLQMVGGRNPKEVFYSECEKHGLDADEIVRELTE